MTHETSRSVSAQPRTWAGNEAKAGSWFIDDWAMTWDACLVIGGGCFWLECSKYLASSKIQTTKRWILTFKPQVLFIKFIGADILEHYRKNDYNSCPSSVYKYLGNNLLLGSSPHFLVARQRSLPHESPRAKKKLIRLP